MLEHIPIENLKPNPHNTRRVGDVRELADSVREQGIIQPLVVTPDGQPGAYYIVAGHRRYEAARLAGLESVPCIVRAMSEREQALVIIVENLQRRDLSPLEEARAFQRLKDEYGLGQNEIARQIGCSGAHVNLRLQLLRLDEQVQGLFDRGELPVTLASVLAKVADLPTQRRLATLSAKRRLTPDALRDIVSRNQGEIAQERSRPKAAPTEPALPRRPGRLAALAALQCNPQRAVRCADFVAIMDTTCGLCADCGMSGLEEVCAECPLPLAALRLAGA